MTDTLTPNYLTVNPDGTIGALFTGGLQLNAETIDAYPPLADDSIGWVRAGGGGLAAWSVGLAGGLQSNTRKDMAVDPGGALSSSTYMDGVANQLGQHVGGLQVDTFAGGFGNGAGSETTARLRYAANLSKMLYRGSDGASDFLQLLSTQKLQVASGRVGYSPGASGWGTVAVPFGATFTGTPVFIFSPEAAAGQGASILGSEARSVGVTSALVDINSSVAQSMAISWLALGAT